MNDAAPSTECRVPGAPETPSGPEVPDGREGHKLEKIAGKIKNLHPPHHKPLICS